MPLAIGKPVPTHRISQIQLLAIAPLNSGKLVLENKPGPWQIQRENAVELQEDKLPVPLVNRLKSSGLGVRKGVLSLAERLE